MSKIEDLMERIFAAIDTQDVKSVRALVEDELSVMVMTDPETIKWIVQPLNLTKLHNKLTEKLNIPHRMFMLRNRIPSQHRRAVMFVKAISNGLTRADTA